MKFIQYSLQVALEFCFEQRIYVDIFYAIYWIFNVYYWILNFKISNLFNKVMGKKHLKDFTIKHQKKTNSFKVL